MPLINKTFWRWTIPLLLLAGTVFLLRDVPLRHWLSFLTSWVQEHGSVGVLIFMAVYILGVVLLLPSAWFTVASAIAFGFWRGLFIAAVSASVGAAISFLIARHFGRDVIKRKLAKNEKFHLLDAIVSENDWKIVFLCRLTPFIPFVISNYLFGLTRLRFWPYFFASSTGILPGAIFYIYVGYIGKMTLTDTPRTYSKQEFLFLGLGLLMTILLMGYISYRAKRTLAEKQNLAAAKK